MVGPLSELTTVLPGLQVELLEAPVETIPALLLDGKANVAISGIPDALPERIDRRRLFEERFMILAAAEADLRHHDAIPLGALADAVWIERMYVPSGNDSGRLTFLTRRSQKLFIAAIKKVISSIWWLQAWA